MALSRGADGMGWDGAPSPRAALGSRSHHPHVVWCSPKNRRNTRHLALTNHAKPIPQLARQIQPHSALRGRASLKLSYVKPTPCHTPVIAGNIYFQCLRCHKQPPHCHRSRIRSDVARFQSLDSSISRLLRFGFWVNSIKFLQLFLCNVGSQRSSALISPLTAHMLPHAMKH